MPHHGYYAPVPPVLPSGSGPGILPPVLAGPDGKVVYSLALANLQNTLKRERTESIVLVVLAALIAIPIFAGSAWVALASLSALGLMSSGSGSDIQALTFLTAGGITAVLSYAVILVGPVALSALAWWIYTSHYRRVSEELVRGCLALAVIDEAYGREIEAIQRERWRPNLHRVVLGQSFLSHLNHAAHYYIQYAWMARGKLETRPVYKMERNCWMDGAFAACLSCSPLSIPALIRVVTLYPASLAFKQAVYDYLAGKFDAELEAGYVERIT